MYPFKTGSTCLIRIGCDIQKTRMIIADDDLHLWHWKKKSGTNEEGAQYLEIWPQTTHVSFLRVWYMVKTFWVIEFVSQLRMDVLVWPWPSKLWSQNMLQIMFVRHVMFETLCIIDNVHVLPRFHLKLCSENTVQFVNTQIFRQVKRSTWLP